MFTGIIEAQGQVRHIAREGGNLTLTVESPVSAELQVDQSVSHNGVCLTITAVSGRTHSTVAVAETLLKSNLGGIREGDFINLERAMKLQERVDGHLVQGHVDTTGTCLGREDRDGSYEYRFSYPERFARLLIEKGSVCLNGVSLTVYDLSGTEFSVSIIPYTFAHTNLQHLQAGDRVNLEFDMVGKYVTRSLDLDRSKV
ncbi:riboflavin synthase [Compostibacter hankyongensis]|uniref:Riboflavin synthase n=1 Tax=Compostibacter hankyongensis TaxID=1007089 RepID=A0ABP8FUQ3_9BACT